MGPNQPISSGGRYQRRNGEDDQASVENEADKHTENDEFRLQGWQADDSNQGVCKKYERGERA